MYQPNLHLDPSLPLLAPFFQPGHDVDHRGGGGHLGAPELEWVKGYVGWVGRRGRHEALELLEVLLVLLPLLLQGALLVLLVLLLQPCDRVLQKYRNYIISVD